MKIQMTLNNCTVTVIDQTEIIKDNPVELKGPFEMASEWRPIGVSPEFGPLFAKTQQAAQREKAKHKGNYPFL